MVNVASAFAGPNRTTYQAKIVKPDGYPLEASSVNFKFTIMDPGGTCILFSETYSSVNMSSTGGMISFALGSGVKSYPVSATTFEQVFSNITPALSCDVGGPPSYSPSSTDIRKIVMQFHDGNGWQTLPAMSINAVPYAMYANQAATLNGKTDAEFVEYAGLPTCLTTEALRYNGTGFSCVSTTSVSAAAVVAALGYTPADGSSFTALTSDINAVSSTVGSVSFEVASVSSTVFSVSSTVSSLSNTVSALSTSVSNLSASMAAMVSSQWVSSGTQIIYSGGNIFVSGSVQLSMDSAACSTGLAGTIRYNSGNLEFCNGSGWSTLGVAGAGITLLNGSASGSQTFSSGSTGTAFNISSSNGVHSFNIPSAATAAVTQGLLSNADYVTFANKANSASLTSVAADLASVSSSVATANANISSVSSSVATTNSNLSALSSLVATKIASSAASIAEVLGYVPASATALNNYLAKANNLSDLNSVVTARSNLGLGSFATASNVDLGSASATGILAEARLPSFANITSGTQYTKVTVDGKGRVISGAQLAVSDVTTALGYTPASASASTQWTTSGSAIFYNSGNVGIGVSVPTSKLDIAGSLNVNGGNITTNSWMQAGNMVAGTYRDSGTFNYLGFPGANSLALTTGNVERFRITSGGAVGINTTTPVTTLDVSGGIRLSMESATCAVNYAGTLRYNAGTLQICNGSTWTALLVDTNGNYTVNNMTSPGNIIFTPNSTVIVSSTTASTNSTTGALVVNGGLGVAGNINAAGNIVTTANMQGASITATSGIISPYIAGGTGAAGGLTVDSTTNGTKGNIYLNPNGGNVGIGYTTPSAKLHIGGSISGAYRSWMDNGLMVGKSGDSDGGYFGVKDEGANRQDTVIAWGDDVGDFFRFIYTGSGGASEGVEVMRLAPSGNVGIGTATPTSKLQVAGGAIRSDLGTSGTAFVTTGTGSNFQIVHDGTSNVGLLNSGGGIQFRNTTGTINNVTIMPSGNVGLGTATPAHQFSTTGNALFGEGGYPAIYIRDSSWWMGVLNSTETTWPDSDSFVFNAPVGRPFVFQTGAASRTEGSALMYLDTNNGNLGVGTNTPIEKLDVNGNLYVRGQNIFMAHDDGANANNDYLRYDDNSIFGAGGMFTFFADSARGQSFTAATGAIAAKAGHFTTSLNVGTVSTTRTLEVNGSIAAGGLASEQFAVTVDGVSDATYGIGSLTNNGKVTHVTFDMTVHNSSTIDALKFQVSLPSYSNGVVYSNWQELPVAFGSSGWEGRKNYVIDVLRSNPAASGATFYFRVRNKNGYGSSSTMTVRMTYNSDATFTRITHANSVGTAFNAGSAAAGGAVDGMYGALEYSFPVSNGSAWKPADNTGLFVKNSGYVGIGTSTPSEMLEVSGSVKAVAYLYTSDRRLKKEIVTLPSALENVLKLRGVNFVWRSNDEKTMGFIAQEVEEVYPELVKTDQRTGLKAVQYGNIVAVLVEALKQENKERVDAVRNIQSENQQLKERLDKLEKFINEKLK